MDDQEAVRKLMKQDCMVDEEAASAIDEDTLTELQKVRDKPVVIRKNFIDKISERRERRLEDKRESAEVETKVETLRKFEPEKEEKELEDFVKYYNDRFERLKNILMKRRELRNAVSISRLESIGKEEVSVIGMVEKKYKTKNGRYIVNLEDPTGYTKVLVSGEEGTEIINDEVIGVIGNNGDGIIFADKIVRPDVPIPSDLNKTEEKVYAAFLSDLHFGSKDTMDKKLDKFIGWLKSDRGVVSELKYLFIVGDLVEGIGIYEGQEDDLNVTDIYKQYEIFSDFIKRIPSDIEVIISPGNHDIVRMAEPQPPIPERALPDLYDMENVHMVSNPAWIDIHGLNGSEGIGVLLYHGYSFDNHVDALPELRKKAYTEPACAMVDYLKRRHLAPAYGSNLIAPEERDYLVIDRIPDIFAIGHIHNFAASNYKGINLICASTFQAQTEFQKRIGHKPDPGKVTLIDLQTRKTLIKMF